MPNLQNRASFPRGFLGQSLTLYHGINKLDPALVNSFNANCPRFKSLIEPASNTPDARKPIKPPVVILQSQDGLSWINYLDDAPTTFTCPKVLFPAYKPGIKDSQGHVIYDGKLTVSAQDYATLQNSQNEDCVYFRALLSEGQIRTV